MNGKRSLGDAFTSDINEKVVSIIAKETGFQGIQPQALDSLSNILGSCKNTLLFFICVYSYFQSRC
jgi:hypothetical protein